MLPKPPACSGCPFEHTGAYYVPDEVNPNAKVIVVAQNPGQDEERGQRFVRWGTNGGEVWERHAPAPLIGKSGHDLTSGYLPLAGLSREMVECRNVVRCRVRGSNELPPLTGTQVRDAIRHCQRNYFKPIGQVASHVSSICNCGHQRERHPMVGGVARGGRFVHVVEEGPPSEGRHGVHDSSNISHLDRFGRGDTGGESVGVPLAEGAAERCAGHEALVSNACDGGSGGGLDDDAVQFHGRAASDSDQGGAIGVEADSTSPMQHQRCMECGCEAYEPRVSTVRDTAGAPVIVALGAYALWALTGEFGKEGAEEDDDDARANRGIDGWRGWQLPYRPVYGELAGDTASNARVFATWHPAYFYRAHWLKAVGKADWARLGRLLAGRWPEPVPEIVRDAPARWPVELAFDTEYWPNDGRLIRYSTAWRDEGDVPRVQVVEAGDIRVTPGAQAPQRVVQHNAEADWPYLVSVFGEEPPEWDDTMMMHSVLYGTWRHTLDFLGSLYARTNRWKHLEQSEPIVYSGLDALGTWDVWRSLQRELARDTESSAVYNEELKPLLKHLMRRPHIRVATDRVAQAVSTIAAQQREAVARAQAAAGWPINPSSADQLSRWLGLKN